MRRIRKSKPPASFTLYIRQQGAGFSNIDREVKDDLNKSLLDEQGWVCGYCQRRIHDPSQMTIEHFCEQKICNGQNGTVDKRLDYTNFMAVCSGNSGYYKHCDKQKANFSARNGLPINVSPWVQAHMNGIVYGSTGKVNSSNATHAEEIDKILNLNMPLLKEQRRRKYSFIMTESARGYKTINKDKMRRLLEKDLEKAGQKFTNDFPGLSEYMLRRYC